ncbi:MAG TPA: hypothetical protein VFJ14_11615 [Nocardioidaceae bacterium]|nr:hypothetical protein [Nocardioidaceae bacterium]
MTDPKAEGERRRHTEPRPRDPFGDVLPDRTSDESAHDEPDHRWGDARNRDDEWLLGEVPPHHG